MQRRFLDCPRLPRVALALQVELLGQPLAGLHRGQASERCEAGQADETQLLLARGAEVRRGRAKGESTHALRVPAPDQLGDRAAHRVAHRDDLVDAEHIAHGDCVVGTVLQAEHLLGADAAAVAAVVDCHDSVVACERAVTGEPIEVRAGGPPVQQQDGRRIWWAIHRTDKGRAAPRKLHRRSRWKRGSAGRRRAVSNRHYSLVLLRLRTQLRRTPPSAPARATFRSVLGIPPSCLQTPRAARRQWAIVGS